MSTVYREIASGDWSGLDAIRNVEASTPSGTNVVLELHFPARWPGFSLTANAAAAALTSAGVHPWSDGTPLVVADSDDAVWYIRWYRNPLWAAAVIEILPTLILAILTIAVAAFIFWRFLVPALKPIADATLKYALLGAAVFAGLMISGRSRINPSK